MWCQEQAHPDEIALLHNIARALTHLSTAARWHRNCQVLVRSRTMRVTRSHTKIYTDLTVVKSEIDIVKNEVDEDTPSTSTLPLEASAPVALSTLDIQVVETHSLETTGTENNVFAPHPLPIAVRPDDAVGTVLDESAPGGVAYCTSNTKVNSFPNFTHFFLHLCMIVLLDSSMWQMQKAFQELLEILPTFTLGWQL